MGSSPAKAASVLDAAFPFQKVLFNTGDINNVIPTDGVISLVGFRQKTEARGFEHARQSIPKIKVVY
jgi:hypothetical protein